MMYMNLTFSLIRVASQITTRLVTGSDFLLNTKIKSRPVKFITEFNIPFRVSSHIKYILDLVWLVRLLLHMFRLERNWKCFHSSYTPVLQSKTCQKIVAQFETLVLQFGNQNSAPRFNGTIQNKCHLLYCNVLLLLQFTVYVFEFL